MPVTEYDWSRLGISLPAGANGNVKTTCPKCSHTRRKSSEKCLSVKVDEGVFQCHHCGWSGHYRDEIDNPTSVEGESVEQAVSTNGTKPVLDKTPQDLQFKLPESVVQYFKQERSIDYSVLREYKVCFEDNLFFPGPEEERPAIGFPSIMDGEVYNIKYRARDKHFRMETEGHDLPFGIHLVDRDTEVIVFTEGEIDALTAGMTDFRPVVGLSVPNGASSKLDFLDRCADKIRDIDTVVLATDDDEPGQELQERLARQIGREKCYLVNYPDDCKDLNDVLMEYGRDEVRSVIKNAQPYPIDGVFEIDDLDEEIDRLYEEGYEKGLSTGWPSLNNFYTVRPGEVTVVTGYPNCGKSAFMDNLAINMAKEHDWEIALCSPENHPPANHATRMITKWVGKPFERGARNRITREELREAKREIGQHFHWIMPDEDSMSVDTVLDLAKACLFRRGIEGFYLDPWNAFDHNRNKSMSYKEYISESLEKFRRFARHNSMKVWIVAHPKKPDDNDIQDPPSAYSISGAAEWNDKADNVIAVWRDLEAGSDKPVVLTRKIRFQETGKIGKVQMQYEHHSQRFVDEIDDAEYPEI